MKLILLRVYLFKFSISSFVPFIIRQTQIEKQQRAADDGYEKPILRLMLKRIVLLSFFCINQSVIGFLEQHKFLIGYLIGLFQVRMDFLYHRPVI